MEKLPCRKSIRLKNYDYSDNGYYFVTICTQNREKLFGEIVGATLSGRPNNPDKIVTKWLLKLENKFKDIKIDEYIVMPNHVHFIIKRTGEHTGSSGDHSGSPLQFLQTIFLYFVCKSSQNNIRYQNNRNSLIL